MSAGDEAEPGREALRLFDEVLAARPEKDGTKLTALNKRLCAWRDAIIARHRSAPLAPEERDGLERLNGVIGVAFGVQFPQAAVPWDEFVAARGWLADLLSQTERRAV